MRLMSFILTILFTTTKFKFCKDHLDCPLHQFCVGPPFLKYCKDAKPVYRPARVIIDND